MGNRVLNTQLPIKCPDPDCTEMLGDDEIRMRIPLEYHERLTDYGFQKFVQVA